MFCTEVVEVRVERRGDPGSGWRLRLRDLQCGAEREIRADLVILTGVREQVTSHNTTLCCIYCMQFISKYEGTEVAGAAGSSVHGPAVPQQSVPPRPPAPLHGEAGPGGGMQVSHYISISPHISPCPVQPVRGGHRGRAVHHGGQGAGERGAGRGAHQGLLLGEHRAGGRHRQVRAVNKYK